MRQIFSIRFFAAIGAVVGLFFLLTVVFASGDPIAGVDDDEDAPTSPEIHRIDLVEQVFSSTNPNFRIRVTGATANETELVFDETRSVRIAANTPAVDLCTDNAGNAEIGDCAIVADLLGDGVVWFALVPMGANGMVDFPAIDVLDDGYARLFNGWELRYAPILDRRCQDDQGNDVEFASYREFRDVLGDNFTSVFAIDEQRLVTVICDERVPYAPPPTTTTTPPSTSTSVPR